MTQILLEGRSPLKKVIACLWVTFSLVAIGCYETGLCRPELDTFLLKLIYYFHNVKPPNSASQTSAKRLFLITDEDNPHPGNAQLLKTATNTLFDLKQLGVVIQTFFISPHDKPFKQAKFWAVSFDIFGRELRF
jgi:hypothetical protein